MLIIREDLGDLKEIIYLCSVVINLELQNMTRFEKLLEKFNAGDKTASEKFEHLFRSVFKDREQHVLRELYGIGCYARDKKDIGSEIGLTEIRISQIQEKCLVKFDYFASMYPEKFRFLDDSCKLEDCDGVTDVDFKKLNLDKETTVKEYIDHIENERIQCKKVSKRQAELYQIAKSYYPLTSEIDSDDLAELDKIPLDEMQYYLSSQEFRKNYNHINQIAPTVGALVRWDGIVTSSYPKVFEIASVNWKRFVLCCVKQIITNRKEFLTEVEYPIHYDANRSVEENLKTAWIEIADTLDSRVDNMRYKKKKKWANILRMKFKDNLGNDVIGKENDLTPERIRQIISEITSTLLNGEVFCDNIKLNPALLTSGKATNQPEIPVPVPDIQDSQVELLDDDAHSVEDAVFRVGCNWEYIEDSCEVNREYWNQAEMFEEKELIPITDRVTPQVCIIRNGEKFGIFTLDHTNGFGGPGTWCTPTVIPFPYDEVKYCVFPWDYEYGVFAFRIGDKWGVIEVVDGSNDEEGIYDVEYLLTKRRIIVPCGQDSLASAELLLKTSYNWKEWNEPYKYEFPQSVEPAKRDVKKGKGRDKIRVTFPDKMVIEDSVVWKTMAETIKRLGVENVEKLKIPGNLKYNIMLVDTHLTDSVIYKEQQKEIKPGFYLLTYNNTQQKAKWLEQISDELHANLKIEIVSNS